MTWIIAVACVAGCGQKGPLYLPDPSSPTTATRQPAPEAPRQRPASETAAPR